MRVSLLIPILCLILGVWADTNHPKTAVTDLPCSAVINENSVRFCFLLCKKFFGDNYEHSCVKGKCHCPPKTAKIDGSCEKGDECHRECEAAYGKEYKGRCIKNACEGGKCGDKCYCVKK